VASNFGDDLPKGGRTATAKDLANRHYQEFLEYVSKDHSKVRMVENPTEGGGDVVDVLE
jgi:hypothetical protein